MYYIRFVIFVCLENLPRKFVLCLLTRLHFRFWIHIVFITLFNVKTMFGVNKYYPKYYINK